MASWTIQIAINFDNVQLITPFIMIIQRLYCILKRLECQLSKIQVSFISKCRGIYNLPFVIKNICPSHKKNHTRLHNAQRRTFSIFKFIYLLAPTFLSSLIFSQTTISANVHHDTHHLNFNLSRLKQTNKFRVFPEFQLCFPIALPASSSRSL